MRWYALSRVSPMAALLLCIGWPGPAPSDAPSSGRQPEEMRALVRLVEKRVARGGAAWRTGSPAPRVTGPASAGGARRPDGTPITSAEMRAAPARFMAIVVRL